MDIQKVTKLEELVSSFRAKYNEITKGRDRERWCSIVAAG